jgi:hypothetical protein
MDVAERVLELAEATRGLNRPSCPAETGAIVQLIFLFFLFFAPDIGRFSARVFSFAVSMAFPVFGAHRRSVNRLYFFAGDLSTSARLAAPVARLPTAQPDVVTRPDFSLLPLFFVLFFHCFPLFLRRRLFARPVKALHCISHLISDCRSPVFVFPRGFPANVLDARPARCLNRGGVRRKNTVLARTSERILIRIGFVRRGSEIG